MIAKVALALPIATPFDYYVPCDLEKMISKGARVKVPFRNSQRIGYVVGFSEKSNIKGLKTIISLLDRQPIIDRFHFKLAKYISNNYFCSLGQAIEITLPNLVRKGRRIEGQLNSKIKSSKIKTESGIVLLHDLGHKRWDIFQDKIRDAIKKDRGVIILSPEINSVLRAKELIEENSKVKVSLLHSKNTAKQELEEWLKLKHGEVYVAVGTSFAVFAPINNLGLIIIDDEDNAVYKNQQSPYYNAKDIAIFRAKQTKANLILASLAPSIESYYFTARKQYRLITLPKQDKTKVCVQIVNIADEYRKQRKKHIVLSGILENAIRKALMEKAKVLLFLNRVGFATHAACNSCDFVLKCSRCSKNLIFIFGRKQLLCRHCNFKIPPIELCPQCGKSYIRYTGIGTEKLESQLHQLFPQSIILRYDKLKSNVDLNRQQFDILITTQIIMKDLCKLKGIDLLGILSLDLSLTRVDFRAAEKTYQLISRLISAIHDKVIIQTHLLEHYIIKPLIDNDYLSFWRQELKQRKDLSFPPFKHLVMINLRGVSFDKVKSAAEGLVSYLREEKDYRGIEIFDAVAAIPLKLRGNFRYNILLKTKFRKMLIKLVTKSLGNFKRSGIIITVDIDPL